MDLLSNYQPNWGFLQIEIYSALQLSVWERSLRPPMMLLENSGKWEPSAVVIVFRKLSGSKRFILSQEWCLRKEVYSMHSHKVLFLSILFNILRFIEIRFGHKMPRRSRKNLYNLSMFSDNQFGFVNKHCFATSGLVQHIALDYFWLLYWMDVSNVFSLITIC